jgi:hypothetical protein
MVFILVHHFIGDEGILREVKWLNKPNDTPEKELYQWQWIPFGYDAINLTFKTSSNTGRVFEEGKISFDHLGCTFQYFQKSFRLNRLK